MDGLGLSVKGWFDIRNLAIEFFKCVGLLWIVMHKPKILMLGLVVVISLFSFTHINSAFATQVETEAFTATLSGRNEVPSPVTSGAKGVASFNVIGDGSIEYNVNVTVMDRVTAAHIHDAPKGENGQVVVTLFKADTPTGELSGNLAKGSITNSTLEGNMQGLAVIDLIKAMERGETYVNVHTEANPKGEIRGQIEVVK